MIIEVRRIAAAEKSTVRSLVVLMRISYGHRAKLMLQLLQAKEPFRFSQAPFFLTIVQPSANLKHDWLISIMIMHIKNLMMP